MKLRDVEHKGEKFNIHCNRFVLFDRLGRRLNEWEVAKIENYLDINVLKIVEGGYNNIVYFVGFSTTHIKLDICNDKLLDNFRNLGFGGVETGGY